MEEKSGDENNDDSLLLELIISDFFKLHLTCDSTNYRLRIGESTFSVANKQRMIKFLFQQKTSLKTFRKWPFTTRLDISRWEWRHLLVQNSLQLTLGSWMRFLHFNYYWSIKDLTKVAPLSTFNNIVLFIEMFYLDFKLLKKIKQKSQFKTSFKGSVFFEH